MYLLKTGEAFEMIAAICGLPEIANNGLYCGLSKIGSIAVREFTSSAFIEMLLCCEASISFAKFSFLKEKHRQSALPHLLLLRLQESVLH